MLHRALSFRRQPGLNDEMAEPAAGLALRDACGRHCFKQALASEY